ncbi:unnamed protein product [Aphanomyces euteiches]|uniref:Peptidase S1 domain-containing protein n=1 Tax=Aphanomyces euteiches TaxID=100861 RepID=A0A6G0WDT8_9STRA|nr:hypothetical protein Ae201684_016046 [Aphanomyces euteiches]KAH9078299.1 hypothetical protein Ae201684P_019390 [Aphanomyces euteiches]KAH9138393.1 hypothetical protein AeRB84_017291 [Aphanomyces euteiches]
MFHAILLATAAIVAAKTHLDVIGGEAVPAPLFPDYIALLVDNTRSDARCTGSLISPWYILTAAHCGEDFQVAFLGANAATGSDAKERHPLAARLVHPKFTNKQGPYDFALFKLENASKITPVPISWDDDQFNAPGVKAWIRGYGKIADRGPYATALLQAQMTIDAFHTCNAALGNIQAESMTCVASKTNNVCDGDSGGPLTVVKNGQEQLVGVANWGPSECSIGKYVYGRLSAAKSFVDSVIPPPPNQCVQRPMLS